MNKGPRIFIIIWTLCLICSRLASQDIEEYILKAVWIGKFTHFIEWPEEKQEIYDTFNIGIYKEDPFMGNLDTIYNNVSIWDKPVAIKRISDLTEATDMHIIFVPNVSLNILDNLIAHSYQNNILLISDTEGFAEKGVHINFYFTNNNLRFEINETAIHNSGFFVSFRLLNIAHIVQPLVN